MANNLTIKAVVKAKDLLSRPVIQMAGTLKSRLGPAMQRARRAARRVEKRIRSVGLAMKRIVGFGAKLAKVGAILGGFAGFSFKNIIDAGDEMGKYSRQIGFTVESLQELRYASERSGTGTDILNASLQRFNKRRGLLKANQGPLLSGLKNISPTLLKQIKHAKSNEEAFNMMIRAIAKVEDPNKKATLAIAAFGDEGMKMTRMAEGGAEGLEALRKEARKYGLVSTDEASQAEAAADAMFNLKQSIIGVGNAIGAKVLPLLTPLMQRLADWIVKHRELIATKIHRFVEAVSTALQNIDWAALGAALSETVATVRKIVEWMGGWGNASIALAVVFSGILGPALSTGMEVMKLLWTAGKPLAGLIGKAFPLVIKLAAGAFTKVLIPAILLVGKAIMATGAMMMANPIILAVVAIGAAVAGLVYVIYRYWEPIKGFFISLWDGVVAVFWAAVDLVKQAMQPILDYFNLWWETIKGVFGGLIDFVVGIFTGDLDRAFGGVKQIFQSVSDYILGIWNLIKQPIMKVGEWLGFGGNKAAPSVMKVGEWMGFGGNKATPSVSGSQPRGGAYAPAVPSAMPRSASPGGERNSFAGEMRIRVESDGTPVKVDRVKTNNRNVGINANVGQRSFAHGGI